jgi:hypothetical protein
MILNPGITTEKITQLNMLSSAYCHENVTCAVSPKVSRVACIPWNWKTEPVRLAP